MKKKGRLNFNRVINDRSGFTLAELLLVVGIIVILTGISFVAASYYFKVLKLNEMDNTAKQIFIAAQNHLTSAQSTGELDRYAAGDEAAENTENSNDAGVEGKASDEKALGVLMDKEPSDIDGTTLKDSWPDPNEEFYYILHDSGNDNKESVLKYVLPNGAIDDYVNTEGKYIIEYNVETASVYGVFYTESKNELTRDIIKSDFDGNPSGRGGDAEAKKVRRDHEYNGKNQIIGYYGGAMAEQWIAQNTDLDLNVQNGNALVVEDKESWTDNGQKYERERLTAIIRDYNNEQTGKIVLKVHGETSGNEALVTVNLKGNSIGVSSEDGSTLAYQVDSGLNDNSMDNPMTFGKVHVINPKSKEEYREYQIVLDDSVIENDEAQRVNNCHFAYLFPTLIPGENIRVTAYAYQENGAGLGSSSNISVNSLFGKITGQEKVGEITKYSTEVSSFRHLENMDTANMSGYMTYGKQYSYKGQYISDGEKIIANDDIFEVEKTGTINYAFTNFKQVEDLDWDANNSYYRNETLCGVSKESSNSVYSAATKNKILYLEEDDNPTNGGNIVHPGTFCGIRSMDLLEYDGNNKKISNVKIHSNRTVSNANTSDSNANGGLFSYLDQSNASRNDCTIRDLYLLNFEVTAPKNVAVVVAESQIAQAYTLKFENVLSHNDINHLEGITSEYDYEGNYNDKDGSNRGNGGAFVGYCGSKVSVLNCGSTVAVKVTGEGTEGAESAGHYNAADAGGFVGEVRTKGEFKNSYVGGITSQYNRKEYNPHNCNIEGTYTAGGILGRGTNSCNISVDNCYTTCSVSCSSDGYVGGLIGLHETGSAASVLKVNKSYTTGLIIGNVDNRGTMVGTARGKNTFSDSYYLIGPNILASLLFNLQAIGSDSGSYNVDGVTAKNYSSMVSGRNKATHGIRRESDKYPFRTVNKTTYHDLGSASGVHYGDWPSYGNIFEVKDNYGDLLFAYREEFKKKNSDGDVIGTNVYWYVVSKDNAGNYEVVMDTLPKERGSNELLDDSSWSYGFLCPSTYTHIDQSGDITEPKCNGLGMYFQQGTKKDNSDEPTANETIGNQSYDKNGILNVNGEGYTFWKYSPKQNTTPGDIVTTPEQYTKGKTQYGNVDSQFRFNTKFAAAITTSQKDNLGTSDNKYWIRSEQQLQNINSNTTYLSKQYRQNLDVDLMLDNNADFTSIGKTSGIDSQNGNFKGVYLADIDGVTGPGYSIKNFSQTISENDEAGLFGGVSGGTIRGINLTGRSVGDQSGDANAVDIQVNTIKTSGSGNAINMELGGLASHAEGNIDNCSADIVINASDIMLPNNLVYIGGMIGNNIAVVTKCNFNGKLILNDMVVNSANTRLRIGGFAGKTDKPVYDSNAGSSTPNKKVAIEISFNQNTNQGSNYYDKVGGFIGEYQKINNGIYRCNTDINLAYDLSNSANNNRKAHIGGFVGSSENSQKVIKNAYASGEININCEGSAPYPALADTSKIGQFGFLDITKPTEDNANVAVYYRGEQITFASWDEVKTIPFN